MKTMKIISFFGLLLAMGTASAVFTSCSDGNTPEEAITTLSVDRTAISATATTATYPIAVTSNSAWTVSSNAGWCTISPPSGRNNGTITVNVEGNTTTSSRSATITVIAGTITKTVTVTQEAANATLTLDKTSIAVTAAMAINTITVTSNSVWSATVSSGSEWCTISPVTGISSGTITVIVPENTTTSSRWAAITITAGLATQTVIVTQEAVNSTLTLDKTEISVPSAAAIYPIAVTSNVPWTATVSPDAEWCTISPTSAIGSGTIMVNVTENTTTNSRSAMITVTTGAATQTVIVTQEAANTTLILDQTSISAPVVAASYNIEVMSNSTWTVSNNAEWCTISSSFFGIGNVGNGIITVNVAENTTTYSRSATITVTAGTITQTVIVTQAADSAAPVELEMVTVAGGTTTLSGTNVTLSSFQIGKYEVTQKQWQDVMGSNPSYFKGYNLPMEMVSHDDIQTFLTKLNAQTGKNYRLPTEAEWEYAAKGGQSTHNYDYSGSNTIDDVAWYLDNSGNTTHTVGTKAANELGIYDMSGNVWEWCSGWYGDYPSNANNPTGTHRVYRGGSWNYDALGCRNRGISAPGDRYINVGFRLVLPLTENSTLSVDKTAILATATATSYSIAVTSNSAWTVSSNAGWCTISPTSGINNGTITVNVAENTTTSSRWATITVTTGTATQMVIVTQETATAPSEIEEMVTVAGGSTTLNGTSVTLSSFQIGKYEVTQKQWQDVMGSNPSHFKGDNLPVEQVSHDDIQTFLTKLNQQTGKNYRLPTEAEWEYAAKGGQSTHNYEYSGSNTLDDVAWYLDNSGNTTHTVGTKAPNELGIYDMSGNVFEWCSDWLGSPYPSSTNNPTGVVAPYSVRVYRGGDWGSSTDCRVSSRCGASPAGHHGGLGFRLVLPL